MSPKSDVNIDFISRELAAEMHLPLSVVKPIVQRVFLKITKHLMYGRSCYISKFGRFEIVYRKPKRIKDNINHVHMMTKACMVPKLVFNKTVRELVETTQAENVENRLRRDTRGK